MIALQEAPLYKKRCACSSIYLSEEFETEQQEWNPSIVIDIYSHTPPLSNAAMKVASKFQVLEILQIIGIVMELKSLQKVPLLIHYHL